MKKSFHYVLVRMLIVVLVTAALNLGGPVSPAHAACAWSWGATPTVTTLYTTAGQSIYGVGARVWTPPGCGVTSVHVAAVPEVGTPGTCVPIPSALLNFATCLMLDGISGVATVGTPTLVTYRVVGVAFDGTQVEVTGSCTVAMPSAVETARCW